MSELDPNESRYARDLYPEHNAIVAGWMAEHGLPVTKAPPSLDREVFAWVHQRGDLAYTLRITREVLDFIPPEELDTLLERLRVYRQLRDAPRGAVTLTYNKGDPRLVVPA